MLTAEEEAVFKDHGIKEYKKFIAAYEVVVCPPDPVTVHIHIYEGTNGTYSYENSHLIATPGLGRYNSTSMQNRATSVAQALDFALQQLLFNYEGAKKEGKKPSSKWFSRSEAFDM